MTALAFLGIIALVVLIFYWPATIAFALLIAAASEYLGALGIILVVVGAIVYWIKYMLDKDDWVDDLLNEYHQYHS